MKCLPRFLCFCLLISTTASWAQTAGNSAITAVPGPFLEKRQLLLSKINAAKDAGCGVGPYLNEFNRIQTSLDAAPNSESLSKQIDSLTTKIDEQLARMKVIRTQRPVPVVTKTSSTSGSAAVSPSVPSAHAGSNVNLNLIRQIMKEQYPEKYKDTTSDADLMKIINDNPQLKSMWEKMQGTTVN